MAERKDGEQQEQKAPQPAPTPTETVPGGRYRLPGGQLVNANGEPIKE